MMSNFVHTWIIRGKFQRPCCFKTSVCITEVWAFKKHIHITIVIPKTIFFLSSNTLPVINISDHLINIFLFLAFQIRIQKGCNLSLLRLSHPFVKAGSLSCRVPHILYLASKVFPYSCISCEQRVMQHEAHTLPLTSYCPNRTWSNFKIYYLKCFRKHRLNKTTGMQKKTN